MHLKLSSSKTAAILPSGEMSYLVLDRWSQGILRLISIDQFHKSQDAPVPYHTMLHSEQKCGHFCSELSTVGTCAFCDLWIRPIVIKLKSSCAIFISWIKLQNLKDKHFHVNIYWLFLNNSPSSVENDWMLLPVHSSIIHLYHLPIKHIVYPRFHKSPRKNLHENLFSPPEYVLYQVYFLSSRQPIGYHCSDHNIAHWRCFSKTTALDI